jgi:type II secretory pathway component PulK
MEITVDPHELMRLAGLKRVADVYRTLDKLAIRKEYHEALLRNEMDLDSIVMGIKQIAESSEEDAVKLNAYKTLLKSLGLDEYKESDAETRDGWEDIIRKTDRKEIKAEDYEVLEPVIPEDAKKRRSEEQEIGKSLYE